MKTVLKTVALFISLAFLMGGACPSNDTTASNKVEQSEIYQSYSIQQNGNSFDVTAYFRIGGKTGTTLALSAPSKVTFNGQPMQENLNTSSGTYYTANVPANTTQGVFAFTDRNSKTYSNRIDLTRVTLAPSKLATNGTTPVALPLSGTPSDASAFNLQLNDRMVIVSSGPGEFAEAYLDKTTKSIVILPKAWEQVAGGAVTVELEVRNFTPTQQGTALGGDMNFVYDSPPTIGTFAKAKVAANKAIANKAAANKPVANTAVANTVAANKAPAGKK